MASLTRRQSAPGAIERKYPHIVELAVGKHGLDVGLRRRIMHFHTARHIKPRHGNRVLREGQTYYRWCFSDLPTAQAFIEQFGGEVLQPKRARAMRRRRIAVNIAKRLLGRRQT
jgi:hypothetical protein